MKLRNVLALIILVLSIISPLNLRVSLTQNEAAAIVTLDVCHCADPSFPVTADSFFANEYPYSPPSLQFLGFFRCGDPVVTPFLIAFEKDRPPED